MTLIKDYYIEVREAFLICVVNVIFRDYIHDGLGISHIRMDWFIFTCLYVWISI